MKEFESELTLFGKEKQKKNPENQGFRNPAALIPQCKRTRYFRIQNILFRIGRGFHRSFSPDS